MTQKNIAETIAERQETYGPFRYNATLAQRLKTAVRECSGWYALEDFQKEAIDQISSKISRLVIGDGNHIDSWEDIAGYSTRVKQLIEEK